MSENEAGVSEQAVRDAWSHVNAADEYRKRRDMDNLKVELNKARAALRRALHTDSPREASDR